MFISTRKILTDRVLLAADRIWVENYFALLKELIAFTGLDKTDPCLVISLPQPPIIPVTINRRTVLAAYTRKGYYGFIVGQQYAAKAEVCQNAQIAGSYNSHQDETSAFAPKYVKVKFLAVRPTLTAEWQKATLREMDHGRSSPYRKYHEPELYELAVNDALRATF